MTIRELTDLMKLFSAEPDNETIQACCLAYGGSSYPGAIKSALRVHLEILNGKFIEQVDQLNAKRSSAVKGAHS